MSKTWLITGCSSGFGRTLAKAVLATGDNLVATARHVEGLEDIAARYSQTCRAVALDVTKQGNAAAAVGLAVSTFGALDMLVNNAGFGLIGAIEETSQAEYRPMFDTNVFGLIETTRVALPALRASGSGWIVNMSSMGGLAGSAGFGLYNATKFAVEGISEALAQEVAPFGIRVLIVEPGSFRTSFLGRSIAVAQRHMPEYAESVGKVRLYRQDGDGHQIGDPEKAVAVLMQALKAPAPPLHLAIGSDSYRRARAKLFKLSSDLDAWESVAAATQFD